MSAMEVKPLFNARFRANSWHRRLVTYIYGLQYFFLDGYFSVDRGEWVVDAPKRISLCKYFWSTVLATIIFPFVASKRFLQDHWPSLPTIGPSKKDKLESIRTMLLLGVLVAAWVFIAYLGVGAFGLLGVIEIVAGVVGVIGGIIAMAFGFRAMIRRLDDWYSARPHQEKEKKERPPKPVKAPRPPKVHQPNLFWSFLKAKKARVCPIIQWIDDAST